MSSTNGHAPRAARRRVANNTATPSGAGAAGDNLAQAIGQQVAMALAPFIAQLMQQVAGQAGRPGVACLYCCAQRKLMEAAHAQAVAALRTEYEIACKAAAELGDAAPEFTEPEPPELPHPQDMITLIPVVVQQGTPPCPLPVCYDHMPTEPAAPPERPTGLVTADGRQIVARA